MFNLGKKQSFQPKKLTEQEIQKKLYGEFGIGSKEPAGPKGGYEKPTAIQPPAEPKPQASSSATSVKFEEETKRHQSEEVKRPEASDLFSSDYGVQPDADIEDADGDDAYAEEDFFQEEPEVKKEVKEEYPVRSVDLGTFRTPEKKNPEPVRFNKPVSFQQPKSAPAVQQKKFNLKTEKAKPKTDWKKVYNEYEEKLNNVTSVFRDIFKRTFSFFDFKNEYVRQIFYWLTGFAILILLLVGIHSLNVERENAILASKNAPAKEVKQKVKKAPAAAVQAQSEAKPAASELTLSSPQNAVETPAVETAPANMPAVPSVEQGKFVIQVATYVTEEDAEKVRKDIAAAGWGTFVKGLSRSSTGRVYYSTFIGRYPSYQDAQKANSEFQKSDISKPFKDAFIRTLE